MRPEKLITADIPVGDLADIIVETQGSSGRHWAAAMVFTASDRWLHSGVVLAEKRGDGSRIAWVNWQAVPGLLERTGASGTERFLLALAYNLATGENTPGLDMSDFALLGQHTGGRVLDALAGLAGIDRAGSTVRKETK